MNREEEVWLLRKRNSFFFEGGRKNIGSLVWMVYKQSAYFLTLRLKYENGLWGQRGNTERGRAGRLEVDEDSSVVLLCCVAGTFQAS